MVITRIVTPSRKDGRVDALTVRMQEAVLPPDGFVAVRVDLAIFDPEPHAGFEADTSPAVGFVGTVESAGRSTGLTPGARVAGVGPLADMVFVRPEMLSAATGDDHPVPEDVLAILDASLRHALATIGIAPGERVAVSGQGLGARLAEGCARALGGSVDLLSDKEPPRGGGSIRGKGQADEGVFDLLVDLSADSTRWSQLLPRVRRNGRVLLLLPPGEQVRTFDFYPRVHKASCTLRACRWPSIAGGRGSWRPQMSLADVPVMRIANAGVIPLPPTRTRAIVCQFVSP